MGQAPGSAEINTLPSITIRRFLVCQNQRSMVLEARATFEWLKKNPDLGFLEVSGALHWGFHGD